MISIEVKGEQRLLKSVEKISSRSHRRELMDQIGAYGVTSTQQRFLDQESPSGEKWQPSSRAKERGGETLRDHNHLFNSLSHEASPDHAAWGTNIIYAAIHNFGGVIKAKGAKALKFFVGNRVVFTKQVVMPQREFLGVNGQDESEIQHIVSDWVQEGIR